MNKNIYQKYCNNIQNPALGAAIIAIFVNEYYKNSIQKKFPNLLMIFVVIPLILNKNYRMLLINNEGKCLSRNIMTYLSKINKNKLTANSLHHYVEVFKGYSLASIIFAKNIGLINIDINNAIIISEHEKIKIFPINNMYLRMAKILGKYFANGVTLKLLQQHLEVLF